jgi:hypothetical protein
MATWDKSQLRALLAEVERRIEERTRELVELQVGLTDEGIIDDPVMLELVHQKVTILRLLKP